MISPAIPGVGGAQRETYEPTGSITSQHVSERSEYSKSIVSAWSAATATSTGTHPTNSVQVA